jgi:hypothetical protein
MSDDSASHQGPDGEAPVNVPTIFSLNQRVDCEIYLQNTGTTIWQFPSYNLTACEPPPQGWALGTTNPIVETPPGDVCKFSFSVTSPSTHSTANLRWQMEDDELPFGVVVSCEVESRDPAGQCDDLRTDIRQLNGRISELENEIAGLDWGTTGVKQVRARLVGEVEKCERKIESDVAAMKSLGCSDIPTTEEKQIDLHQ